MMATAALGYVTPLALIVPLVLMGWATVNNAQRDGQRAFIGARQSSGAASALMGFVQMVTAAVLTLLVGYVPARYPDEHRHRRRGHGHHRTDRLVDAGASTPATAR